MLDRLTRRTHRSSFLARQGDVLLLGVDSVPEAARVVPRNQDRIVLAYGEATGHAHAIKAPGATLLADGQDRYLEVRSNITLDHEEHAAIHVPSGSYRVVIQREYVPQSLGPAGWRPVVD